MNKLLSTFSLCRKAGKLILGFDAVKKSVIDGQACAVFTTRDISVKTKKEVSYFCEKANLVRQDLPLTMEDMEKINRRKAGVLSVTEKGLAAKIMEMVNRQDEEGM